MSGEVDAGRDLHLNTHIFVLLDFILFLCLFV